MANLIATILIKGSDLLTPDTEDALPQSADNWYARVIDPAESVDDIDIIVDETGFSYSEPFGNREKYIAVMFDVPFDMTGGDALSTPVDVLIPVELIAGGTTEVEAEVELEADETNQWRINLNYCVKANGKEHRRRCRLNWHNAELLIDEDGDGVYETVDSEPDIDRNCLAGEQKWMRRGPRDGHGRQQGGGMRNGTGKKAGGAGRGNCNRNQQDQ